MHKDGKWAREILSLQKENGQWGFFHTLSEPSKAPMTTEQALRRLQILGYDIRDGAIAKAVEYMSDCLRGAREIPDRKEKLHDWNLFTRLMLSAWIRRFTPADPRANQTARDWAAVVAGAFQSGRYEPGDYRAAYTGVFGQAPRGGRLADFVSFYQVSLLAGVLEPAAERLVMDYILQHPYGIYYVYNARLTEPPPEFASKAASRYIGALELLAGYKNSGDKLRFAVEWLEQNRNADGKWDLGSQAKDGVYFPLSDNWRARAVREADCTERITRLLEQLSNEGTGAA